MSGGRFADDEGRPGRTPHGRPFEARAYTSEPDALDALAERVALRVVELLSGSDHDGLLDAATVARRLGRSRDFVYQHAAELGAVPLGDGPRPRLGFDRAKVAEYVRACSSGRRTEQAAKPATEPTRRRRSSAANGQGADLLPIRGKAPSR